MITCFQSTKVLEQVMENLSFEIVDLPFEQKRSWNPRRFSDNVTLNINRGMNIINIWSGHQMTAWVYDGEKPITGRNERRWIKGPQEKLLRTKDDTKRMEPGDTLYVSHSKLQEWTEDFLPHIETDFVLVNTPFPMDFRTMEDFVGTIASNITDHPNMMGWFCTNIGIYAYAGGKQYHPKVHPFPLGLKDDMGSRAFQNPISAYRQVFLDSLHNTITKTRKVYAGPLSITTDDRKHIPRSKKLQFGQYAREIAKSKYVLSPNGVRPDCHRNYEAIGLGAIPITELDPFLYRHLKEGPVVYENTNWNMTWFDETLPEPDPNTVNRNLVFEEYWMEYIERAVGRPLQWWDKLKSEKSQLVDFEKGNYTGQ